MENVLMQNVGNRIREARKTRGITQAELADRLHIANSHMSDIERGQANFGVDILMRITDVLQVSADWLLFNNTPDASHVHVQEIENIFEGCSPDEVASIIKMARDFKDALRNAKKSVQTY